MYTNLETLPDNLRSAVGENSQRQWMESYNGFVQKSGNGHHREAIFKAWDSIKNNTDCRYFAGFVSSSRVDKQNDSVNADNAYKKIMKQIERGGTMVDTHSNRTVGSFYYAKKAITKSGYPGVYAYGVIYAGQQGEPYCDTTWEAIKKAFECPTCKDIRKGYSIGGFALDTATKCDRFSCHREIIDLSIHEISVCQEPANQDSYIEEINMFAKSKQKLEESGEVMKKSNDVGAAMVDPRQQEMLEARPEEEMMEQAEQGAENIQPEINPEGEMDAQSGGLGEALAAEDSVNAGGEDKGAIPTVEEIKAFKQKMKNLDRILREVNSIKAALNATDEAPQKAANGQAPAAQPAQPEVQKTVLDAALDAPAKVLDIASGEKPITDIATLPAEGVKDLNSVEKFNVSNAISGATNAITGTMGSMASGDIASIGGMPGKVAGAAANKLNSMGEKSKQQAAQQKQVSSIKNAVTEGMKAHVAANQAAASKDPIGATTEVSEPETKIPGAGSEPTANTSSGAIPGAGTPLKKPAGIGGGPTALKNKIEGQNVQKAACGCGIDSDVHTSVTEKKCPMLKELYGDVKDPQIKGSMDYLENKDYKDKTNPVSKGKKDAGLVDVVPIKGKKTGEEGPSTTSKVEKKIPEKMNKGAVASEAHLREDMKEEKDIQSKAEDIKETAKGMHDEDEEVLEKGCKGGAMSEDKLKSEFKPEHGKTSTTPAKPKIKNMGKEGKEVFMKAFEKVLDDMMEDESEPEEAAEASEEDEHIEEKMVEQGNPEAAVEFEEAEAEEEGAEAMENISEAALSAKDFIKLILDFLAEKGIELEMKEEPLENPEIESELEKPEVGEEVSDDDLSILSHNDEAMKTAEALGKMSMYKFRFRMTENRLNMMDDNILEFLK